MRTAFFSLIENKPEYAKEGDYFFLLRGNPFLLDIEKCYIYDNESWIFQNRECIDLNLMHDVQCGFSVKNYTNEKWLAVIFHNPLPATEAISFIIIKGYKFRIELIIDYENKDEIFSLNPLAVLERIKETIGGETRKSGLEKKEPGMSHLPTTGRRQHKET